MSDWAAGYVADLEYAGAFYPVQAPEHLRLAAIIAGFEPPRLDAGFTYCELGCGQGVTANILAAANPRASFYAMDFNPSHILRARDLAEAAGLSNIVFDERSFLELVEAPPADLPLFDVVTMHGIYTWISEENQRAIRAFLRRQVKPGGMVYVSYNAMPGWAAGLPIQRLLFDLAAQIPGRSDLRLEKAVALAEELAAAGVHHLAGNEFLARIKQFLAQQATRYLAHEYLNENWQPLYFADLARQMAEAKLSFVASADLIENYPDLTMPQAPREAIMRSSAYGALRETLKDFGLQRPFRKDVFMRGARRIEPARRDALLRGMRFALTAPRCDVQLIFPTPMGEAQMGADTYVPIFDALARRPHSIAELLALPELEGRSKVTAVELAGVLAASNQAAPLSGGAAREAGDTGPARRHNIAIAGGLNRDASDPRYYLAAPGSGSGILVNAIQALILAELAQGIPEPEAIVREIWRQLSARGEKLTHNGKLIESDEENQRILREHVDVALREQAPVWRHLSMI